MKPCLRHGEMPLPLVRKGCSRYPCVNRLFKLVKDRARNVLAEGGMTCVYTCSSTVQFVIGSSPVPHSHSLSEMNSQCPNVPMTLPMSPLRRSTLRDDLSVREKKSVHTSSSFHTIAAHSELHTFFFASLTSSLTPLLPVRRCECGRFIWPPHRDAAAQLFPPLPASAQQSS